MNTYSTPTMIKETLSNGGKIPIIFYQMNPLRDPNKRINHYRNIFQNETPSTFNKTQISFKNLKNIKSIKKSRKKKRNIKSFNNKLYNSFYQQLFLRINYERPREIFNENGIIISRHFRTLDINSKEYPDQKIKTFYINNKIPTKKKINYSNKGNFFSTEIRYPLNRNIKNINVDMNKNRKYNSISNSNNIFSKTVYASNNINNKFFNIENYNMKKINNKNLKGDKRHEPHVIPPLLVYKNKNSNSNSIKKLNNDIYNVKNLFKVKYEEKKIF